MKKVKNKDYNKELPDDIKILFGKFYFFSLLILIFLGIIFPFFIVDNISLFSFIGILVLLLGFYIFMIVDVIKKRKNFNSTLFLITIFFVFSVFIFNIVHIII